MQESHPLLAGAAGELSVHPIPRVAAPKLWGYARGDLLRLNAVDMKGRAMRIRVLGIALATIPCFSHDYVVALTLTELESTGPSMMIRIRTRPGTACRPSSSRWPSSATWSAV